MLLCVGELTLARSGQDLFTDRLPVVLVILPSCQNKQDLTHLSVEPVGVELPFWCLFQACCGGLWCPGGPAATSEAFHMPSGTLQRLVLGPGLGLMLQPAAPHTGGEAAQPVLKPRHEVT